MFHVNIRLDLGRLCVLCFLGLSGMNLIFILKYKKEKKS